MTMSVHPPPRRPLAHLTELPGNCRAVALCVPLPAASRRGRPEVFIRDAHQTSSWQGARICSARDGAGALHHEVLLHLVLSISQTHPCNIESG